VPPDTANVFSDRHTRDWCERRREIRDRRHRRRPATGRSGSPDLRMKNPISVKQARERGAIFRIPFRQYG
jgi:hypothetical protein